MVGRDAESGSVSRGIDNGQSSSTDNHTCALSLVQETCITCDNVQGLTLKLTLEQMMEIENVSPFVPGYPENAFGEDPHLHGKAAIMTNSGAKTLWVQSAKAIARV